MPDFMKNIVKWSTDTQNINENFATQNAKKQLGKCEKPHGIQWMPMYTSKYFLMLPLFLLMMLFLILLKIYLYFFAFFAFALLHIYINNSNNKRWSFLVLYLIIIKRHQPANNFFFVVSQQTRLQWYWYNAFVAQQNKYFI